MSKGSLNGLHMFRVVTSNKDDFNTFFQSLYNFHPDASEDISSKNFAKSA